jgi:LysM repeat protein
MVTLEGCEMALYIAQANDTLPGIADQFSVSIEEIMEINQLKTEILQPFMKLLIPVCSITPAGTAYPATFTTTYTPVITKPTTSTQSARY